MPTATFPRTPAARRGANAGLIMRTLLDTGAQPRSVLSPLIGMSPASITAHSDDLLRARILAEVSGPRTRGTIGRPSVPIDLAGATTLVGAVHLAVDSTTVALLDLRAHVVASDEEPHDGTDPSAILERCGERLDLLLTGRGDAQLLGIGVAGGGWIDRNTGTLVEHTMLGWRHLPLADPFARRFRVPVRVDSHARSLIRAEQLFGDIRSRASTLAIFVGNVVEAAFAMGEQVHHGPRSRAGAIAHLAVVDSREQCGCGRTGCLEVTVSERTLLRAAVTAGLAPGCSIEDLVLAAATDNPVALNLLRQRAESVGRAVAPLVDLLNPDVVLVIEPGAATLPGVLDALRRQLESHSATAGQTSPTVLATGFTGSVLAVSAGTVLLDALYANPFDILVDRDLLGDRNVL